MSYNESIFIKKMNTIKIRFNKLSVFIHFLLVLVVWALIIIVVLNTKKIGGFVFIFIASLIFILPTILFTNNFITSLNFKNELILSNKIKINSLKLSFNCSDIKETSIYYSPGGTFVILKFNDEDFYKYQFELNKTILGKIHLLNFRIFKKSSIFINLRFIKTNENDLLKILKKCQSHKT